MFWAILVGLIVGVAAGSGVVRASAEWVAEQIAWLTAELNVLKYEFFKWLAEWLENDYAWMIMVLATVALSFSWAAISAWYNELKIVLIIRAALETVKESTARLAEAIQLIDIYTIHQILKLFWPEYRKIVVEFSEAVSGLAKALGEGSGYIHAYFGVIYGLAQVESAYLNLPGEAAQLAAFEETDTFLRKIDERFSDYAHDPGKIVRDIIEEIYVPHANTIRDGQQAVIGDIESNYQYILDGQKSLMALEGKLTHFIAIQPEEMAEIIEERVGPIRDALAEFNLYVNTTLLAPIGEALEALKYRAEILEAASISAADRLKDPFSILSAYLYYPDEMQEAFEGLMFEITAEGEDRSLNELLPALDAITNLMVEATKDQYVEAPPVRQPARTALSFETPGIPDLGLIPSWFQGEY